MVSTFSFQSEYILSLAAFTILLIYIVHTFNKKWTRNLPPGPTALPVIGNLLELNPDNMIEKLRAYRKTYGDVYRLQLGSKPAVVINGYETLKDVFVKNGDLTSDRPDLIIFSLFEGHGMLSVSGERWKQHRAFSLSKLRNFGFGKKTFESKIQEEVEVLLKVLEDKKGSEINLHRLLRVCVSNLICSVVFGKRFEHTDTVFAELLGLFEETAKILGVAGPLNFIPAVKYIPGDPFGFYKFVRFKKHLDSFVGNIIQEHEKSYEYGNSRDFIDAFLDERIDKGDKSDNTFSDKQLLHVVEEFFIAGTDTTSTVLDWAILFLLNYPEMQNRMRKEIESVVGMSRLPSYTDCSSLHFCQAFISEVFRRGNILPFSLMHATSQDFQYRDYIIPKGTILIPSLDSVMMDSENFPDPSNFDPNRFLNKDGCFENNVKVMPFFLGKRLCLGESLARMEFFLFLTAIIQRFQLFPEKDKQAPPISGKLGVFYAANSYNIRAEKIV